MMHIQLQAHYYDQYCKLQLYNSVSCSTAWTMRRTHKEFVVNIVKSEILKTRLGIEILTDRAPCLVGKKKALSVFIKVICIWMPLMKWAILFIIIYETEKAVAKSMDQSASRKQRNKEVFYDMPPLRGGLDYV